MSYRVIVCGGRDWPDQSAVDFELGQLLKIDPHFVVIHGNCPTGADRFAEEWTDANHITTFAYPADWENEGRAAGPKRNERMVAAGADLCLAFWDGESRGTAHMIKCATRAGIPVRIVPARGRG